MRKRPTPHLKHFTYLFHIFELISKIICCLGLLSFIWRKMINNYDLKKKWKTGIYTLSFFFFRFNFIKKFMEKSEILFSFWIQFCNIL